MNDAAGTVQKQRDSDILGISVAGESLVHSLPCDFSSINKKDPYDAI
jgi:hypothetical protein